MKPSVTLYSDYEHAINPYTSLQDTLPRHQAPSAECWDEYFFGSMVP